MALPLLVEDVNKIVSQLPLLFQTHWYSNKPHFLKKWFPCYLRSSFLSLFLWIMCPKPTVTGIFPRFALQFSSLSFDWFTGLSACFLIGGACNAMSPRSYRLRIKRVGIRSHRPKPPWVCSIPYRVTIVIRVKPWLWWFLALSRDYGD